MRIGIDARITHYTRGGISIYARRLLEALPALDPENDYVVLHSRKDREPPGKGPNVHPLACWTPAHHRLERWALGLEIAGRRLDLLHTTDFIPPAFGARRFVITVHDLNFLHYPEFLTAESRRYYNGQIQWAVGHADHILADSHATKRDLAEMVDVPEEKVTVVHLAADPIFRPQPADEVRRITAKYGLRPGYLLFVGTLEPRKNLPGLMVAYRTLLDNGVTDAPLVLVGGKGWLYETIFACVQDMALKEHVRFLHGVPTVNLPALYTAAALLTTPSFYEGFGLPALEAMSCGTPVTVADRASLPEVVGDAGLLFDPDDSDDIARALAQVLTDDVLRGQMRQRGLAQAGHFTWEQTARQTLTVYRQVLHA